jgi:homoserine O-acetyltransferase/O-succinyltransferase
MHPARPLFQPFLRIRPVQITACVSIVCMGGGFLQYAAAQELQFAHLGTCPLESGEVIEECVLGYWTVGELAADGSNAVLLAPWGFGTSEQKLASDAYVGAEGWVDPERYFIIVVDAFGNGVSSSPSNSPTQPGTAFPEFTIRDIIHAQYRLVTEILGIERLHGVAGISMGGMITYGWVTTYSDFVEKAVPVVASPRRSAHDLIFEALFRKILEGQGAESDESVREAAALYVFGLMARSPEHRNRTLARQDVPRFLEWTRQIARGLPETEDLLSQLRATDRHDITEPFDGSMERAAAAVRAEMLIVVNAHDLLTTPEPSRDFAELAGARLLETDDDCGHQTFLQQCSGEEPPRSGTSWRGRGEAAARTVRPIR